MAIEYAAIVVTPDAIRDGLKENILNDFLIAVQMEILLQKHWRITSADAVISLYPKLVGKFSLAPVIRTMMAGGCLVVLVRGENLYARLREIKGGIRFRDNYTEVEVTGLRLKYRTWSFQELFLLKSRSYHRRQTVINKIFEYRVHTTENLKETAVLCVLCMDDKDIENLKTTAPELSNEVIRLKSESV